MKHCVELLQNNQPKSEFLDEFLVKNKILELGLQMEEDNGSDGITKSEFDKQISNFGKKQTSSYDFITKAGVGLKSIAYELVCKIWESENIPDGWKTTTLVQIFKRGPKEKLSSYRYIHMKNWLPRLFEGLIFNKIKPALIQKMSKFQIGAKPGHQSQEHIFVLKSIIVLYKMLDIPLFVNFWDIKSHFDRQQLKDALESVYQANVKGKPLRLLYNLNRSTKIQTSTAVGTTHKAYTGENTGQGSLSSAIVSSLNLDRGFQAYFPSSNYNISYGKVKVEPLLLQDDSVSFSTSQSGAQDSSRRMEMLMKSKQLEINVDKSVMLLFSSKRRKQKIIKEISNKPVYYDSIKLGIKTQEKWLGDVIDSGGDSDSISATIP